MNPRKPLINLRIPVAMIEQKLEGIRSKVAGENTELVAQLAASLAVRKISIPNAHCRVGKVYPLPSVETPKSKRARRSKLAPEPPAAAASSPAGDSPTAVSHANADAGIAAVLSPSQVRTWFDCQARWYFSKVAGLPDPKNGNLALGTAVHDALAYNFHQKIESKKDLPLEEVLEVFDLAWCAVLSETVLTEEQDAAEIAATGRILIGQFMRDVAPAIQPISVEMEVNGEIGGVKVTGRVDILDDAGRIHDFKTRARTPNDVEPDEFFQLATYSVLTPKASGEVRIHSLVKIKNPKLVQLTRTIDAEDIRAIETQYPLAQEGMRAGLYMPNRTSMMCSRRNCSFWRECQIEFGGRIPLT